MFERDKILSGMTVRSADGDKLGKVVAIQGDSFVVEKGIFFPKDFKASFDQIDGISGDDIYLKWGTNLVESNYDSVYGAGSYANETSDNTLWSDYNRSGFNKESREQESREHMSVPLREEELSVQKGGLKETGRVRIVKTVSTEEKHFTVPLRREEVRVERVPADEINASGSSLGDVGDIEEKTITVPIREEELTVTKRPVVKEELRVTTESETIEKPVSGEVRKEDVRIERDDDDIVPDRDHDLDEKKAV